MTHSSKNLPAHISALLDRQQRSPHGQPADSAGTPWSGRDLSGEGNPLHTFDGDDGLTTPVLGEARRRLLAGDTDEPGFVNALAGQRLFAPVIASGHADAEQGDKEADISLVTLTATDGRSAMPVFTSVEELTAWHPEARPVAAEAERVMLAALAEGAQLLVLDPSSTTLTFVVRGPAMEALARGETWTPSYQDQELAQALAELPAMCPGVTALRLSPGRGIMTTAADGRAVLGGGTGPELSIGVVVAPHTDTVGVRLALAAVQAAVEDIELLRERADSVQVIRAADQP
ncbi:SseB family protein [Nesterenkonia haasae]|uniref:SseB family protein n=1 Tax=Nesterenkonia haasae TaxID=2587813 RepID=UPI001390B15F|nr:SseB family protein [Nesterenkonia haasae]NDK33044.1 SseB family protein [Nesterenkonia haasae]